MPEVSIRPASLTDVPSLLRMSPRYESSRVWQLERGGFERDMDSAFREVRLPRPARIEYPRTAPQIFEGFQESHDLFLTALLRETPAGFLRLSHQVAPATAWVKDLVVHEELRLRGIGAALLLAALEWSLEQGKFQRVVVEMQSKNYPAYSLVRKLGFDFSGFSDQFYFNKDIALFFSLALR